MIINYANRVTEIANNCPEFNPVSDCGCSNSCLGETDEVSCPACVHWDGSNCHIYLNYIDQGFLP